MFRLLAWYVSTRFRVSIVLTILKAQEKHPFLQRFAYGWPIADMMKQYLVNSKCYAKRLGDEWDPDPGDEGEAGEDDEGEDDKGEDEPSEDDKGEDDKGEDEPSEDDEGEDDGDEDDEGEDDNGEDEPGKDDEDEDEDEDTMTVDTGRKGSALKGKKPMKPIKVGTDPYILTS